MGQFVNQLGFMVGHELQSLEIVHGQQPHSFWQQGSLEVREAGPEEKEATRSWA